MLKFVNSRCRNLIHPLITTLLSHLHTSQVATLLTGLQPPSTTSFHGHQNDGIFGSSQFSHPWPEWEDLMELLLKRGYFDGTGTPLGDGEMGSGGKDSNLVRTAFLNFGRDRVDLLRHISRGDIRAVVGIQCQSLDRKVVNSGKRLRAYVGIDEGTVCSSCSLRGDCDRANLQAREDQVARTVDVMRILLTFGLDHAIGSVENGQCENISVTESVRSILREIVVVSREEMDSTVCKEADIGGPKLLSTQGEGHTRVPLKQGDWICPKCNFSNFARNIKCLRCHELFEDRVRKMIEDQDQLPLKKGDWICEKCRFLNFAKNSKCKLCQEKPPKRKLDGGEWQCDSCHYVNFRKNTICLRCDHRRPKASASSNPSDQLNYNTKDHEDGLNSRAGTDLMTEGERGNKKPWQFVDENNKGEIGSNQKGILEFMNFPILGGSSTLSQSKEEREKWKSRMRERSKCVANEGEKGNGLGFASVERPEFLQLTDDEEMEEWFGQVKDRVDQNKV